MDARAGAATALDQKSSRDVVSPGKYAGTSSWEDFTKMGHQDRKFKSFQNLEETIELKDELDRLVQDGFCKLKIRAGRALQLLANSEPLHNKDFPPSLWNQTAMILK